MKEYILLIVLYLLPHFALGQKISVTEFNLSAADKTASTLGTVIYDQNDIECALIKIQTTAKGLSFDNGSLGIQKKIEKPSGVWVYVPATTKFLTISHEDFGSITYKFSSPVKKGMTYSMLLAVDEAAQVAYDKSKKQRLILNVTPKKATVKINGEERKVFNGTFEEELPLGKYGFTVSADKYHACEDSVVIFNLRKPHVKNIALRQAFGWLRVDGAVDVSDATLFVDNENLGKMGSRKMEVASGAHHIRVVKPLYAAFEQNVVVQDSAICSISPVFSKDFGKITLKSKDKDAEIWIDGQRVGVGMYSENINSGNHKIECRKSFHKSMSVEVVVENGQEVVQELEAPVPLYASLTINTGDVPAIVVLDAEKPSAPTTSYYKKQILIGTHKILVKQKGYRDVLLDVTLKENENFVKNIKLCAISHVKFESNPSGATLYIDKERMGNTPIELVLDRGKHAVKLEHAKCYDFNGNVDFNQDELVFKKSLAKEYFRKKEIYVEGFGQFGSLTAYGGAIGIIFKGLNVEAFIKMGAQKSEPIYFNSLSSHIEEGCYPSEAYEFQPKMQYGAKLGWALPLHGRWRVVPQIGAGVTSVEDGEKTYVMSGSVEVKLQFALTTNVCLSLSPEYVMAISKGDLYDSIAPVSSKVKGWGTGFNLGVGLNIFF